jgi:four helix bundle protein
MSKRIEKFEDFVAWRKARVMTGEIYKITEHGKFARDFGLRDQIQRAAVSVMSNIAEGFERGRASEFHQFLSIAKASCAEVRSQLYIALDVGYLTQEEFNQLMEKATETRRIIRGLRASVEQRRDSR